MAIDEVLLTTARPAILRFYRWNAPSVSFGYFVRFAEAREIAGDRAVVRRWTGGGIVPHGEDLTYSIMIGAHACFANPVVSDVIESGRKIAGAAQRKTRSGLLHQGSIQRGNLDERFRNAFAQLLGERIVEGRVEAGVLHAAEELAATKYATVDWLRRR